MNGLKGDLRDALRSLRRTPAFALLVILTLALGVGATAAIFSVVRQASNLRTRYMPRAEPFVNAPFSLRSAPVAL